MFKFRYLLGIILATALHTSSIAADSPATVGTVISDHPFIDGYYIITELGPSVFRDEVAANLTIPERMSTLGYGIPMGGNSYLSTFGLISIAYVTAYTAGYPGNLDFYYRMITVEPTSPPATPPPANQDPGKTCPLVSVGI